MLPDIRPPIPGPRSRELAARLRRCESRNVTFLADDWPIFWERAEGTNVWDADGNRFLDLTSAFGVAGLGHTNSVVRSALVAQSAELMHAMGDVHPTEAKTELCERLSALTFERWGAGTGKVILGNSGFEAVEAALKTAFLHRGKPGVLAFTGGYHGLGFGAVTVTGLPFFREPFRPLLNDFATFVPYPNGADANLDSLHDQIDAIFARSEIGCMLVEPIQGRGGCIVPPSGFLPMLRELCDRHQVLLVLDEIYTGFNRTGALFACDHTGIIPDLICLGKGLTSGFPLSACVGKSDIMDAWPPSTGEALHTSTFLGHPLGCAMALASLDQHTKPEIAPEVLERGVLLKDALSQVQTSRAGDARGMGLMLGLELCTRDGKPDTEGAIEVVKSALSEGIILLADGPAHNVLSLSPPFDISREEIEFVTARLRETLGALGSSPAVSSGR